MLLLLTVPGTMTVAAAAEPPGACVIAAELTAGKDPQRALRVIDEARELASKRFLCADERREAERAAVAAVSLLGQAEAAKDAAVALDQAQAARSTRTAQWRRVDSLASGALDVDETVQAAATLKETAADRLAAMDAGPVSRDWVGAADTRWRAFLDSYLKPLGALTLVALVTMTGLVLLARLLLVFRWGRVVSTSTRRWRTWVNVAALAALTASGVTVAGWLPGWISGSEVVSPGWLAGLGVLLALTILLVAYSLATRLRLTISVRDAEGGADEAGTTQLVAFLRELGAENPVGLEVPRGTDVDILEGKSIVGQTTGWATAGLRLVQSLAGFTPWRVVLDPRGDDLYVVVSRNGRSVDSAAVSPRLAPSPLTLSAEECRRMAAAFVLVTLAKGYHPTDFAGLVGATEWRSVGLHYVATSNAADRSPDQKKALHHEAVRSDPENLLAQIGLQHARYRRSENVGELRLYALWLWRVSHRLDPDFGGPLPSGLEPLRSHRGQLAALRVRALVGATAVALNHRSLDPPWPLPVARVAADLRDALQAAEPGRLPAGVSVVAEGLMCAAESFAEQGDRLAERWLDGQLLLASPTAEYNAACALAERGSPPSSRDRRRIMSLLRLSVVTEDDRDWLKIDPSLRAVMKLSEFTEAFGTRPRQDLLSIPPFDDYADALRNLQVVTPQDLLALSAAQLAEVLGVRVRTGAALRDTARLVRAVPAELAPYRFEIVAAAHGLRLDLTAASGSPDQLAAAIVEKIEKLGGPAPDAAPLATWLTTLRSIGVDP